MSVYDQLMARFKRPNKTSLTRQEAVAPTPGQAASNLSAPPLSNGAAPAATIPASSVRAGRRAVDVNKAKDPDRVKENMELINGGASNTTDETTAGAGSVKPTSHSVEVHDAQVPKYDSYDRMLEFLQANQVADADADARARRREMFASIGDGISAISSLYQTTKGAPLTYTPGADMTKVMRDRYDRMIAQRKADSDKYLNYLKVQNAKEQADELREYKRTNQEIRREELERQKKNDKAREDYRNMGLRLRDLERQRKIANSPGGDVYFKTLQDMIAEGYSEEDAENEAMKELAAYNTQHGTNYTIVDKRDNSGKVSRTVTVKTNDQQTAGQVEQVANSNVDNAPAPKTKSSGKGGKKKSSTNKPKMY